MGPGDLPAAPQAELSAQAIGRKATELPRRTRQVDEVKARINVIAGAEDAIQTCVKAIEICLLIRIYG
jgi:hypothetical protein